MRRFLVDTNVIVDVMSHDPVWSTWSAAALAACSKEGQLAINPIIYAELSAGFARIEDLEAALPEPDWTRLALPWPAGFLAGRAFARYRKGGGLRPKPLPDFYIGAHAAVKGLVVVTRDATPYRTYFPTVELVSPPLSPTREPAG